MPDRRRHRGPDPRDPELFAPRRRPALRQAAKDLSWLLGRNYALDASLKLVGDHFQLQKRQRMVLKRGACSAEKAASRRAAMTWPDTLVVDGFNVVVATEALFSGGLLVRGLDGLLRDLSSVHGSYRRVEETQAALDALCGLLEGKHAKWYLDRPVSNSGRLAAMIRERGFDAECVDDADKALGESGLPVATSDGYLLDRASGGVDLVGRLVTDQHWILDLSPQST